MIVVMQSPLTRGGFVAPAVPHDPEVNVQGLFSPSPAISTDNYYDPGVGNPAVSTADYYHLDGLYWFRCYDLTQFGATGISIAAARGRYFWIATPDHPSDNYGWADGQDFMGGHSDDPGVLPKSLYSLFRYNNSMSDVGGLFNIYQAPYLVYNPDGGNPFRIYAEGYNLSSGIQHEEGMADSADLLSWTMRGPTHPNLEAADWSSFQRVVRRGTGDWYSVGLLKRTNPPIEGSVLGQGVWTSTDGLTWTPPAAHLVDDIGDDGFEYGPSDEIDIDGVKWSVMISGANVSLVAHDSDFNVLSDPPPIVLATHSGAYPGPEWPQGGIGAYAEDGILHVWPHRGFPPSSTAFGLVNGATYANGGGLWEQFCDYLTYIYDATAAALAAPVGVRASCDGGVVTLVWYDALPHTNYRVYKGSSAETQATLVGNVSGVTTTDSPTADQQWWYKVVTMSGGVERGYRIVRVYVSDNVPLVNEHIDRVIADGADAATIDVAWLATVAAWLDSEGLTSDLLFWTDPSFGVIKDGSNIISKVYCLGTTRLPRGGDYTPSTGATTYDATGLNSTAPAWINANTNSFGYFGGGRLNNIRRKAQITFVGVYSKSGTNSAVLMALDEFGGMGLSHSSGTPGDATFWLTDEGGTVTATATMSSATGAHIIAGTFDGTTLKAYADGVAGTGQTGLDIPADLSTNSSIKGQMGTADNTVFLGSGSTNSKYVISTETHSFSNGEAQYRASALIVFGVALTSGQMASLMTLLETRNGL